MNTSSHRTALVLGGGGSAGNAWLIGVVAGMADAGLDVTDADLIVGTSAGATAAAQVTSADPAALLEATVQTLAPSRRAAMASGARPAAPSLQSRHLERLRAVIADSRDVRELRRRMGAELRADASTSSSQWRSIVAQRLPRPDWPDKHLVITAVDAESGIPVLFDRDSGVDLVDAVAASCAGGFAYRIGERHYIDGGYRLNADNADLALGYSRVLVVSPLSGGALTPLEWGTHLVTQVERLRDAGGDVETVFPDERALVSFGNDLMDPTTRRPAALAGFTLGQALAESMTAFWRDPIPRRERGRSASLAWSAKEE